MIRNGQGGILRMYFELIRDFLETAVKNLTLHRMHEGVISYEPFFKNSYDPTDIFELGIQSTENNSGLINLCEYSFA